MPDPGAPLASIPADGVPAGAGGALRPAPRPGGAAAATSAAAAAMPPQGGLGRPHRVTVDQAVAFSTRRRRGVMATLSTER